MQEGFPSSTQSTVEHANMQNRLGMLFDTTNLCSDFTVQAGWAAQPPRLPLGVDLKACGALCIWCHSIPGSGDQLR